MRSLGIALVALVACADSKPERPKLSDSVDLAASASSSATAGQPPASVIAAPTASASAGVDVSYPDDTIPAPSGSSSSRPAGKYVMDRAGLERILQGYAKQAGSTRGQAKEGITLRRLKPDDALSQIGLQDGDVVQDINGFDMRDPDKAIDAYARLRRAARVDVRFVRDGKPMTIVVELK